MPQLNTDQMLAEDMASFYDDPLGFVLYAYPWSTDASLQIVKLKPPYSHIYGDVFGPDLWACDFLTRLSEEVRDRGFNGVDAVNAIRFATASGHGIGKSAITAWIVDWIMSTRPFAKGVVTATTSEQLSSKTWAEICKWTRRCITSHWFDISTGKGNMRMTHKDHPEAWQCVALTCREENAEAFAGLHAANSTPFYIFDEGSGVPDPIWSVAEGGLTDGEPMFFAFGNPTRNSGAFYDCFHKMRHRWITQQIDSRSVSITNKAQIDQWIADYGLDSDFVKVRVRGVFPAMSAKQFISVSDVDAAYGRQLGNHQYIFAPKIITCDPAWSGDDKLVIAMRQGLFSKILREIPKNDNDMEIANILMQLEDEYEADAVFIDAGYGTGIYSAGQTFGRDWMLVWFGAKSADIGCLNKRSEMWKALRDWLKAGGAIPEDSELYNELIAPETKPRPDGLIQLESKEDMKKRGQPSPNKADALALSFAYPVTKKSPLDAVRGGRTRIDTMTYNPMQYLGGELAKPDRGEYDPLNFSR